MFQQIAAFLNVFNPFLLFICTLIWLLVLKVVNKQHDELRHRLRTLEMWAKFNDPFIKRKPMETGLFTQDHQ